MFEKHFQTGLQTVLVGMVLWVGSSILDLRDQVATLTVQREEMARTLDDLRLQMYQSSDQRYRAQDAQRDFAVIRERMEHLERRILRLERGEK